MPSRLADAVFWAAVVCCAIAQLLITRSTIRSTPDKPAAGTRSSELAWVMLPAVALVVLFVLTWREMHPRISSNVGAPRASEVAS